MVVDFTASLCPPCRQIAPVFAALATKFPDVVFLKVDVDELKVTELIGAVYGVPLCKLCFFSNKDISI